jgi:hypothetical protein
VRFDLNHAISTYNLLAFFAVMRWCLISLAKCVTFGTDSTSLAEYIVALADAFVICLLDIDLTLIAN